MPANQLYLNDARLGRFRPQARKLHQSFLELVSEAPCSPVLSRFLALGATACSGIRESLQQRLRKWQGIERLQEDFARSISGTQAAHVVFASRAKSLMQFAARMLFQNCRRCLTVDCNWPAYQSELAAVADRMGGDVVTVSLRDAVLHDQLDVADIAGRIASVYQRQRCDGVFLPLVDPWGIRLAVREIIQSVQERCATRFVVVDAAQALGHVELDSQSEIADFVIAGTHKWVGSYFPIGVGLAPNPRSQRLVAKCLATTLGGLNDGLLQFLVEITHGRQARAPETVNLGPLVAACGAWGATPSPTRSLPIRLASADRVAAIAVTCGWSALRPHRQLHSGSLLLQATAPEVRCLPADRLTMLFAENGIHLTAYEDGVVRLAMPERSLPDCGIAQLATAFRQISAAESPVTC